MSKKLYEESNIQAIADAIRAKNSSTDTYTTAEMAEAIENIPSGGSVSNVSVNEIRNIDITSNYRDDEEYPDLTGFTPEDDTIYYIIKTTEDICAFILNIRVSASSTITLELGTITDGAFVSEKTIYTNTSATLSYADYLTDILHKFTVIKFSTAAHINDFLYPTSIKLGTITADYRESNLCLIIEVLANIPYMSFWYGANGNTGHGARRFTEKISFYNLGTGSSLTTLAYIFYCQYNLLEFAFINCDFTKVTAISSLFNECWSLKDIDLTVYDFSNVTNISAICCNCYSLKSFKIGTIKYSTSLDSIFRCCYNLKSIEGILNIDVSNSTSLTNSFLSCYNLELLDLSNWNITNKNTSCFLTFSSCHNLKSLLIGSLDLSKTSTISSMFNLCYTLEFTDDLVTKLENANIASEVTSAPVYNSAFQYCYKLQSLNMSSWNFTNCASPSYMFYLCSNLKSIVLPSTTYTVTTTINFTAFVAGCASLLEFDISMFTGIATVSIYSIFSGDYSLKKVALFENEVSVTGDSRWAFANCYSLLEIINLPNLNTSSVTNFDSFFNGCSSIKELDLSNFNVGSTATSFNLVFYLCSSLKELNLNGTFSNTKITNFGSYFVQHCFNLEKINVDFAVTTTTAATNMFSNCYNLKEINMPNVNLNKVTGNSYPFGNNINLTTINIGGYPSGAFDISSCAKLSEDEIIKMFNALPTLTSTKTLTLGKNIMYMLSDTTKAIATGKGWTLA